MLFSKIDGVTGEKVSSVQIRNRSIQFAKCLFAIGVRAGDTVGVFTLNRMEFAYVMIGSFLCGATVAPLNVTYTSSNPIKNVQNIVSITYFTIQTKFNMQSIYPGPRSYSLDQKTKNVLENYRKPILMLQKLFLSVTNLIVL